MSNFRSVEFWKESIMTLPDNNFFELLRTVFGKIKTPFNKQVLMDDLEQFLARNDIKENIAGYIDLDDARIIAAVAVLNEPVPGDLETFFAGDYRSSTLHDLIINLEERFILYRFFEKAEGFGQGYSRLALNPLLASALSPFADDAAILFPAVAPGEDAQSGVLFDDRILAALLSFVSQNTLFFKTGGGIRQKVNNAAKTLFPAMPLQTIMGGLQVLGLFFAEDETLVPDHQRFAAFGALSRAERLGYCAAGILCYADFHEGAAGGAFSPWLFRASVRSYAQMINCLYNTLDARLWYPHSTLRKRAYTMRQAGGKNNIDSIITAMERVGLIANVNGHWRKTPCADNTDSHSPAIVMDTPFTILVYPEIAYNDAVMLASFSTVIEAGMAVRFELSRDSAAQAFNKGICASSIVALLRRLSHDRIDESLVFTLNDWEKCHGEVTLRRALVLTLAPSQRHLAQTKPLAKLIVQTLAPGIYLIPESEEEKAAQALHKAGVAIIARPAAPALKDNAADSPLRHFFPALQTQLAPHNTITGRQGELVNSAAPILIERFHSILNTMRLGKEERDELAARVERRLVLCESQLKDAVVRYEKLQARGLDYVGKAVIAKQAIALQSPVEIVWPGKQKQESVFGIPKALEKTGGESVLVIDPLGDGNTMRIPLGKISLLRRIKKSIFEGG